jgi:hypothetical protein
LIRFIRFETKYKTISKLKILCKLKLLNNGTRIALIKDRKNNKGEFKDEKC